jgi:hypothetical protein
MGLLSSIGNAVSSVGKTIGGAVSSPGKIADKVLNSKIFNLASTAMMFIPGLNAAGLIGKSLAVLGKASTIQKWITTGMNVYSALKNGNGLTEAVKNLAVNKFQPLGALSSLAGGNISSALNMAENLKSKLGLFQEGASLLKQQLGQNTFSLSQIQSASTMFQELVKQLNPRPFQGNEFIVRA